MEIASLAKMIDHSLLHPTMTDIELMKGCELARKYKVASVCIKPYAVKMAAEWLVNSEVLVGTVIGFPHGSSSISTKVKETEQAFADGAKEVDLVVNIGKVLSNDWGFIHSEIQSIIEITHSKKGILKVIFENDFLPNDDYKIRLCQICSALKVHYVKTSTGYGMVKGTDGKYSYQGATDHDLELMRNHCSPETLIKAAGGIRTFDDLLRVRSLGVSRVGATATASILDEASTRFSN